MADIRNGSYIPEEIITILSSSDEEESRPSCQLASSKASTSFAQQENQSTVSTEDNTFPKITCSYSLLQQERELHSRIVWRDSPDLSFSQPDKRILSSVGLTSKAECHSYLISNGVSPEPSESVEKDDLLKEKVTDSNIVSSLSGKLTSQLTNSNSKCYKAESEAAMEKFVAVCRAFVDDDDGKKIVNSASKYYSSANTDFVHSKHFCDFITKKSKDVSRDSKNVFLHIKDVIDELRPFKQKKKSSVNTAVKNMPMADAVSSDATDLPANNPSPGHSVSNFECKATSSALMKRQPTEKQIKRLERLLQKIDKRIKHLEKKELSLNSLDDSESSYILVDRFKKRFIKVWKKLCSLTGRSTETGREIEKKFRFNGSRYPEINEKISKFINKKKIFPDYSDILSLISSVNSTLKLPEMQLNMLAREIFEEVGKMLKERRCKDNLQLIGCSLTDSIDFSNDPAEHDETLKSALEENSRKASKSLDEIIDKYAMQQTELKLEPEDVKDDEKSEQSSEEENDDEHESEKSDVEFIEGTVASDDEDPIGAPKDDEEPVRAFSSEDEKSPPSACPSILGNYTEENSKSCSNSSISPPLPSFLCVSNSSPSLPTDSHGSKRPNNSEIIPSQAKIPCLEYDNCLSNPRDNVTSQNECHPQIDDDDDIIIVE